MGQQHRKETKRRRRTAYIKRQKEIAKTTARPVNPNIANTSELMTPFSQINVKYENMELCGSHKKEWQTRWTEMFNASKQ